MSIDFTLQSQSPVGYLKRTVALHRFQHYSCASAQLATHQLQSDRYILLQSLQHLFNYKNKKKNT